MRSDPGAMTLAEDWNLGPGDLAQGERAIYWGIASDFNR